MKISNIERIANRDELSYYLISNHLQASTPHLVKSEDHFIEEYAVSGEVIHKLVRFGQFFVLLEFLYIAFLLKDKQVVTETIEIASIGPLLAGVLANIDSLVNGTKVEQ